MIDMGYEASVSGNKLTIRDVPIFVECERGDMVFDAKWIDSAVDKAMIRQQEGYYPPLHVRHHEPTIAAPNVQAAGYFRITGTRLITFKGDGRTAVFADLIITDPGVAALIKEQRLPYRSVEIFDVDKPGIDSLALLDHEAPFLELPMLSLSRVDGDLSDDVSNATFSVQGFHDEKSVVAFRRDQRAHLLFREAEMTEKEKDNDENMEAVEGTMDIAALVAAIESGEISVADMEALTAAIGARTATEIPEPVEDEPEMVTMNDEDDYEKPAKAATPGESMSAQFAAVAGENRALKARVDAMQAESKRDEEVAKAMAQLDGKPLGSNLKAELSKFHADHGSTAFAAYVQAVDKAVGVMPNSGANPASIAEPASVAATKYLDLGAKAVDQAVQFSSEWQELSQRGYTNKSEDRYIAVAMARNGFHLS